MTPVSAFIHLHVHSEYSVVDGIVRVKKLIDKAAENKMPAVGLTDMANLFAMVKFYKSSIAKGVKPLFGADIWVEEDSEKEPFKLILFCQSKQGYANLTELISKAYLENQKLGKPLVKLERLKEINKDLIAISHPSDSNLHNKDLSDINTAVKNWLEIFSDRFYIGLSRVGREAENNYIALVLQSAQEQSCPVVALNEVCFLEEIDFEAHETRVCIHEGVTLDNPNRNQNYTEEQYFKSSSQMLELFKDIPSAIENTVEIAKRCNFVLNLGEVFLPNFPTPNNLGIKEYFRDVSKQGLDERLKQILAVDNLSTVSENKLKKYYDRLDIELKVINDMGFAGYFLIVADFIQWAKNNDIPVGPGRGSGAGSLVAYALQITNLEPMEYDLLFERFLNPERVSMPDFDIDFCMEGRDKVIDYVANKYGKDAVSQIITYGTMAAKAVVRDVGRVLGHPYGFVDGIAKLIPMELGITLKGALEDEALFERYQKEEEVKNLIDLAKKLEGVTRNVGKHAGGVVIAPSKITDFSPIYCEEGETQIVSQFDKNDIEEIGLVKFDFLGLRTLTIIDWAIKDINRRLQVKNQPPVNIDTISLKDQKTFELLQDCKTTAVFQLESRGMKDLIKRLIPDCFEDIVALVALFRPGPLQSGMVDDFIDRKLGRAEIEYPHPLLEPILKPTYGVILYQEQVMQIAQSLAGYTLGAADLLRRAMGKKKPEEMAKQRTIFTEGAVENGIEEETATYIFDLMEKFAGYGFNKSHSAAYALISYQTAWLKAHYPEEFMAAVLSSDMNNTDKVSLFIEDTKALGLKIIPPEINSSFYKFTVNEKREIVYGLGAIKGIGEAAIENIILARKEQGVFTDMFDFCSKVDMRKLTKRGLEALIKAGAFDMFTHHRAYLFECISTAVKLSEKQQEQKNSGQMDIFGNSIETQKIDTEISIKPQNVKMWGEGERLSFEKDTLGLYLTGHPITEHNKLLSRFGCTKLVDLHPESGTKRYIAGLVVAMRTMITKRGDKMAFIAFDDPTARHEIALFADTYLKFRDVLQKDKIIVMQVEVGNDPRGGLRIRAHNIMDFDKAKAYFAGFIKIDINSKDCKKATIPRLKQIILDNLAEDDIVEEPEETPELDTPLLEDDFSNNHGPAVKRRKPEENFEPKPVPIKVFYHASNNAVASLSLPPNWRVHPSKELLESLACIGAELKAEICYN